MVAIAKIALYAWVPFTLLVFAVMTPRRAVIFAYIGGWLFLPMFKINFAGIPDLTKITASSFGVLLGALIFDFPTLIKFRPKWFDLPMGIWCMLPFVTSSVNNLGTYDGVSSIVQQLGIWGIPYFIGRIYFKDLVAYKELGVGIVIGALCYMPFTWTEMLISPQLHKKLYGFFQHDFAQTKRWGSYRPMVFMQSGLALAMYMTTAALCGIWMWLSGTVKKIAGVPMAPLMGVLFVTSIFCKTMSATAFLFMGVGGLLWIKYLRKSGGFVAGLPILFLVMLPPAYMYVRASGVLDGDKVVAAFAAAGTAEDRVQSLEVRLKAEDLVVARAFEAPNPMFGWGKWDPNDPRKTPWRIYLEWDKVSVDGIPYTVIRDAAPTDGLWIITMGQFGKLGTAFLTITIIVPALILWRRIPLRYWHHPIVAPAAAMSMLLLLHMVDNLLNGMLNPIFMLALGGISAIGPAIRPIHRKFGEVGATAVLDQLAHAAIGGPAGGRRRYPAQPVGGYRPPQPPYGQPGYGQPAYAPAGYGQPIAYPQQAGYPPATVVSDVDAFPPLGGLQPGQARRGPRR
jgi:hypothetical protein